TTAKPLTITVEAPIRANFELFETPQPAVETATERRWRIDLQARKKTEFVRKERMRTWRKQELRQLDCQNLQHFLENRWLDKQTYEQLADMLDALAFVQRARAEQDMLANERKTIYTNQEQLRANLNTLQSTGQEAGLRKRMLDQLEGTQNRLDEIEQRI